MWKLAQGSCPYSAAVREPPRQMCNATGLRNESCVRKPAPQKKYLIEFDVLKFISIQNVALGKALTSQGCFEKRDISTVKSKAGACSVISWMQIQELE